jgi:restriction system protein
MIDDDGGQAAMQAVLNAWHQRAEQQRRNAMQSFQMPSFDELPQQLPRSPEPELLLGIEIVRLGGQTSAGDVVESVALPWRYLLDELQRDPAFLHRFDPRKMEELVAAAYRTAGYDVVLTPRSGDFGRDVIATRPGHLSVRILDQVKKYAPGNLVPANDVRALLGVLHADHSASKAVITTTSDFAPRLRDDPFIAPFLPTRLELRNGNDLKAWLADVGDRK